MDSVATKLKIFLSRFFRKYELKEDDDIFSLGFVNSLFAMQLVMFLEKEFSIKIDNTDLDMKNFCTIKAITDLVNRKMIQ